MPPCKVVTVADYDAVPGTDEKRSSDAHANKDVNQQVDTPRTSDHDPILKGLYIATSYLSFAMVAWIMVAPASWLIGRSTLHREVLIPFFQRMGLFYMVPESIVTKYQEHWLVHFTHLVPGAIWAGCIPFQLHPTWRKNHRKLHRRLGYLFLTSAMLIVVGVFIIIHRKLTYENYFSDLPPDSLHFNRRQKSFQVGIALWFAGTGIQSVRMARAKKFSLHQKWMYRHVGGGIWIAVQRMVLIPIAIAYFKLSLGPSELPSQWVQREVFGHSAVLAIVISLGLGEYVYHRVSSRSAVKHKKLK